MIVPIVNGIPIPNNKSGFGSGKKKFPIKDLQQSTCTFNRSVSGIMLVQLTQKKTYGEKSSLIKK